MRDFNAFLWGVLIGVLMIGCIVYIFRDTTKEKQTPQPTKNYDCKGTINSRCPVDTVYYDQHPQQKCWHAHWERGRK